MGDKEECLGPGEAAVGGGCGDGGGGGKFQLLQPSRDLQSNWEVDLAKNLEEYLLKICSGEATDHDHAAHSVNFAEAALLLQGSIQVYSRKVEYLYSLVLHALEFLSHKKQDQPENASIHLDGGESTAVVDEDNEIFLGLDDVPVQTKNFLDAGSNKDDALNQFLKPPANFLVLEGDCLDTGGDVGELESYLLATCDLYGDFLLLDPCDAGAAHDYLNTGGAVKEHIATHQTNSVKSKTRHHSFPSPSGRSGGNSNIACPGKMDGTNLNESLENNCAPAYNSDNIWLPPHFEDGTHEDGMWHGEEHLDIRDDSDSDDPWKPLNPHEPGNLKIKPFKKGKTYGRQVIHNAKQNSIASQFPIAKLEGTIDPEFVETLAAQIHAEERLRAPHSPPLYEKLRRSLVLGEEETPHGLGDLENENDDNSGDTDLPDFDQAEFDFPHSTYDMETDVSLHHGKQKDKNENQDGSKAFDQDNLDSHTSLEDLCRSHLDALLASIAETEKQTELAARVSTWKQQNESNLEEQERHPPFDIHQYGERILDKLSLDADSEGCMSFADLVTNQPKHEVARIFSALLQHVNNGDVDLQRPQSTGEIVCYTAENPFYVRCLHNRRRDEIVMQSSKKRVKSPSKKGCSKVNTSSIDATLPKISSHQNGKLALKHGKGSVVRCTPERKRRRRSRLVDPIDLQSRG